LSITGLYLNYPEIKEGLFIMIEKKFDYSTADTKKIEIIVEEDYVQINHMVLNKGEGLPEHYSNSNVNMIVIRGTLSLQLNDQETHTYTRGNIVSVPFKTKMNVNNLNTDVLEFFVVKAPHPRAYKQ
jgi:quercetin dioxygenase-like cupin family protein